MLHTPPSSARPSLSHSAPTPLQTHIDQITDFIKGNPFVKDGKAFTPSSDDVLTIEDVDSETSVDLAVAISDPALTDDFRFKYSYDDLKRSFSVFTRPAASHEATVAGFNDLILRLGRDIHRRYPKASFRMFGGPDTKLIINGQPTKQSKQPDASFRMKSRSNGKTYLFIFEIALSQWPASLSDTVRKWLYQTDEQVLIVFIVKLDQPKLLSDVKDPSKWGGYMKAYRRPSTAEAIANFRRVVVGNRAITLFPNLDPNPILQIQQEDLFIEEDLKGLTLEQREVPFTINVALLHEYILAGIAAQAEDDEIKEQEAVPHKTYQEVNKQQKRIYEADGDSDVEDSGKRRRTAMGLDDVEATTPVQAEDGQT